MRVLLRDYQEKAVIDIRAAYAKGFMAPLLVLSTGAGKTVIFCDITERVIKNKKRVYTLVHRQELLRQTSEHLTKLGVDHGLIAPGHCMTGDAVQIASVQTLVRRLDRLPEPDLIISDECHHANAGTWRKVFDYWPKARILGVTATPCRLDGTGLGKQAGGYFDCMIEGPSIRDLIDRGHLAPPLVYAPPSGVDLTGVKIQAGDYQQKEVSHRVDKPKITGCAIDHYKRLCPGVPAIVFCSSVEHAEHVAAQFNDAGIVAAHLSGDLQDTVRKHRIQALANGQIQALTSCDIISEGTDIPVVGAAILLRPTQSVGLFLQQVGRALRPYEGKRYAIILDHVGNCLRHGLPDDIRDWSLEGSKKKKRAGESIAPVRQCARCYAVFSPSAQVCPQCGFERQVVSREINQVNGNLVQISKQDVMREKRHQRIEVWQARTLEDLIAIGQKREYHPDWAYRVWQSRKSKQEPPTLDEYKQTMLELTGV